MKQEVMVLTEDCDEVKKSLRPFTDTEPKVSDVEGLDNAVILTYELPTIDDTLDDGRFMRAAMQAGAKSVYKVTKPQDD